MSSFHSLIEPEATNDSYISSTASDEERLLLSIAISLRKISNKLEDDDPLGLTQSVNAYGENFAVALQEGLVRGQQGISSYYR